MSAKFCLSVVIFNFLFNVLRTDLNKECLTKLLNETISQIFQNPAEFCSQNIKSNLIQRHSLLLIDPENYNSSLKKTGSKIVSYDSCILKTNLTQYRVNLNMSIFFCDNSVILKRKSAKTVNFSALNQIQTSIQCIIYYENFCSPILTYTLSIIEYILIGILIILLFCFVLTIIVLYSFTRYANKCGI